MIDQAHRTRLLPLVFLAFLISGPGAALAAADSDWPGWGGPHQTLGVSPGLDLSTAPETRIELAWSSNLGSGFSSVVVVGDLAISAAAQGDEDRLVAFDVATGRTRWSASMGPVYLARGGSNDGPLSTPVAADGRIFMVSPRGRVFAVGLADGSPLWTFDLVQELGATEPHFGVSAAPLVVGDRLVVPVGAADKATLAALDTATGAVRWTAGTDGLRHQNPKLLRLADREQIVVLAIGTCGESKPKTALCCGSLPCHPPRVPAWSFRWMAPASSTPAPATRPF